MGTLIFFSIRCICVCEEESDLQIVSYVYRMNVDELGLQQRERGYVTIYA